MGKQIDLDICSLSSSGPGVGYLSEDGVRYVVFVPFTVPGDKVKVKLVSKEKIYYNAELIEIIEKSKDRVEPRCKLFGICGGCDWQCVSYEKQIEAKKNLLIHNLKTAKLDFDVLNLEIISAKNPYQYRDKARIAIDQKTKRLGFYGRKSNDFVAVDDCPILNIKLNEVFKRGHFANANLFSMDEESFVYDYKSEAVFCGSENKLCYYKIGNMDLAYYPDSFVQNNLSLNESLVKAVVLMAGNATSFLELYSGNGNFTISLSKNCKNMVAVEGSSSGSFLLKQNLFSNNITNVESVQADVDIFVDDRYNSGDKYDCIILDPPRVGCDCIDTIGKMTSKIIYVSCNSKALIKDIKKLILQGYTLQKIVLIDMFPQTRHYETVALLEKKF